MFGSHENDIDENVIHLTKSDLSQNIHPWNSLELLVDIILPDSSFSS